MAGEPLCNLLSALEAEVHNAGTRCSRERLEELLHPNFHEVGRLGARYTRDDVVAFLVEAASVPDVSSWGYRIDRITPDVALLSYETTELTPAGEKAKHALRASIWQLTNQRWQLLYHQATAANATE